MKRKFELLEISISFVFNLIKDIKKFFVYTEIKKLFIGSSLIGAIVGLPVCFVLTTYLGVWYIYSSTIGGLLSYIIGFFLQKYWVFENKDPKKIWREFLLYLISCIPFICVNIIGMYNIVEFIHINFVVAQIIIALIFFIYSFVTSKIIFTRKKRPSIV